FAPAFYSETGGNLYALNTLPEVTGSMVIPFGFSKNGSSEFSIELSKSISGTSVFLTDKKTNIVTNLTETPVYNFSAAEGDDANRFTIHFSSVGIDDVNSSSDIRVYTSGGNINVSLQQNSNAVVKIYSLTGQVVLQGNTGGKSLATFNATSLHDGIYIVSLVTGEQTISRKIVYRK
ncbi:MAG: T9SS type A sorting domain-containing protein, partial [Bacteroidales bacterium]|nr:T9SS type A sorting domain-containing protein [Bacteroidales bacterium]